MESKTKVAPSPAQVKSLQVIVIRCFFALLSVACANFLYFCFVLLRLSHAKFASIERSNLCV